MIGTTITASLVSAAVGAYFAHKLTAIYEEHRTAELVERLSRRRVCDWEIWWTDVESALPRPGKAVLVAYVPTGAHAVKTGFSKLRDDGTFGMSDFGRVIAWTPRPKYKNRRNNGNDNGQDAGRLGQVQGGNGEPIRPAGNEGASL